MTATARKGGDVQPGGMKAATHILETVFGYKQFRSHQAAIIETLIEGRDAFVLMPTGGGKSLCYQIPALVREGTGLVVSPLIALMQDQVSALQQLGVRAAFLNSTLDRREQDAIEWQLTTGQARSALHRTRAAPPGANTRPDRAESDRAVCHRRGALRFPVGARLPPRIPAAQGTARALSLRAPRRADGDRGRANAS